MEPCNNKYSSSWNYNLYVHTDRSMCDSNDDGYCSDCTGNTNIHADRTTLSEQYCANTSSNIRQWLCRNLEPGNDQYSSSWNDNLYIHSDRSMCDSNDDGHYNDNTGNTNIHADRTALSEQHCTSTSSNIRQWICRNMEPCNDKYSSSWNDYLYIYTNRSMCYSGYDEHHYQHIGNTNVHTDRTTLSKQYSACTSRHIRQWLCRNLEPGNDQYGNSWNNYLYIYTN